MTDKWPDWSFPREGVRARLDAINISYVSNSTDEQQLARRQMSNVFKNVQGMYAQLVIKTQLNRYKVRAPHGYRKLETDLFKALDEMEQLYVVYCLTAL